MIEHKNPQQAWDFMQTHPDAVLVDVRTQMEYAFVGHPVDALHIPWKEGPDMQLNPAFTEQVLTTISDLKTPVLLLCRSGQRSMAAAKQLQQAGYQQLINIDEGFEGRLDENQHRSKLSGWRFNNLPWQQS
jgi:rhodanese-related sulfurtransferase